jgi:hypothetical protein
VPLRLLSACQCILSAHPHSAVHAVRTHDPRANGLRARSSQLAVRAPITGRPRASAWLSSVPASAIHARPRACSGCPYTHVCIGRPCACLSAPAQADHASGSTLSNGGTCLRARGVSACGGRVAGVSGGGRGARDSER